MRIFCSDYEEIQIWLTHEKNCKSLQILLSFLLKIYKIILKILMIQESCSWIGQTEFTQ